MKYNYDNDNNNIILPTQGRLHDPWYEKGKGGCKRLPPPRFYILLLLLLSPTLLPPSRRPDCCVWWVGRSHLLWELAAWPGGVDSVCSDAVSSPFLFCWLWLWVWWKGGVLLERVIISTPIFQMCATLQLCSPLLFVVIMTIVVVNNEKKRKLISHHHHYHDNNIQISCSSSSDVCAST